MKIVVVINSFGRGGAEKSTAAFMIHLKNKFSDYEIIGIYFDKHEHGDYDNLEQNNIKLYHVSQKGLFKKVLAIVSLIKTLKPDTRLPNL